MKRIIILTIINLFFIGFTKSQNCTQCDNIANPPGIFASELGQNTTANGNWSFTGGYASQSSGVVSFSFGANCNSDGPYSVTLGHSIESYGLQSMVIGTGAGNEEAELLKNNISQSLMIGFGSNKSTLFVKGASGLGYTGSIGIGDITNPLAKLHIKGDNGEQTMLFIEPYAFTSAESVKLRLGTVDYGVSAGYGRLFFVTGGNYIFNSTNAKVGIGTLTPTQKLEVSGNVKITSGYAMTSQVQAIDGKGLSLTGTGGTGIIVANDGKVGIGTGAAPTEKLDVNGNIKQASGFKFITPEIRALDANGLKLYNSSGNGIVINVSGNVGIGTPATSNRLEVAGTVNATSFVGNGSGLTNLPGDNLGNHIATQNIQMNGKWLSGDGGNEGLFVKNDGNVGIGTSNPLAQFEIADIYGPGGMNLKIGNDCFFTDIDLTNTIGLYGCTAGNTSASLKIGSNGVTITGKDGKLGIGTLEPTAMLDVAGKILCGEVEVVNIADWKDCVFSPDYNLQSIENVKDYILQYRHLPDVPSENEVKTNGVNLIEMDAILLQKIEEMTLYIIQLKEEINLLKDNQASLK